MPRSSALVLSALGIALALWTWGTWGDVQVDWGGEVYAAWRVSQGAALYRDVAYFTGPLSPWVNALWFKLFGVGIWTLYVANLLLVALDTALVFALVRRLADRFTATAAGVVFLALFAFGRFQFLNDSNYVAPYSQEVAHALPLALGCLLLLARRPALAGGLFGLVFLTKAEYTLALGAAAFAFFVLSRASWRAWGSFAVAALVAPLLAWAALASALGAREAMLGVIGAWRYVFDARITELAFYRWVMGTDQAGDNLVRLLEYAAAELLLLGGCWFTARKLPRTDALVGWIAGAALGPLLVWLLPLSKSDWLELARPWPLFALVALVGFARQRLALAASFATFGLALLAKMVLNTRVEMYGFALALPASLLVCLLLVETLPRLVERRGGSFLLARALGCGALCAFALGHLRVMALWQSVPTYPIGDWPRRDARRRAHRDRRAGSARARAETQARRELRRAARGRAAQLPRARARAGEVRQLHAARAVDVRRRADGRRAAQRRPRGDRAAAQEHRRVRLPLVRRRLRQAVRRVDPRELRERRALRRRTAARGLALRCARLVAQGSGRPLRGCAA